MKSYAHANSRLSSPTLSPEALTIYRAIRGGMLVKIADGHWTPRDLDDVAERLRCDEIIFALRQRGVNAIATGERETIDPAATTYAFICAEVLIYEPGGAIVASFDGDAGKRLLQRLESGLSLREAIDRTMEQCERPTLSDGALRQMDREADAAQRRAARALPA